MGGLSVQMGDYEEVKSSDWTPSLFICLGAGHEHLNMKCDWIT